MAHGESEPGAVNTGRSLFALMLMAAVISACAQERAAPDYAARPLGGHDKVSLASFRGQVVLLNTWATWCSPCRKEMPAFETLYRQHRDQGLQVVGVNIDEGQADSEVERYVASLGISFTIWRDPENRFSKRFRVLGVPETFLIDREGMITRQWRGRMDPNVPDNLESIQDALGVQAEGGGPPPSTQAPGGDRLSILPGAPRTFLGSIRVEF